MMTCGECHQPGPWNPFGYCSWDCYDAERHTGAPEAFAYFLGLGAPERLSRDE